ncbi:MAG: protease modulator HflC [Victivallales bacterium]|nr:protease modulator HflC [Victivallales bacterium]
MSEDTEKVVQDDRGLHLPTVLLGCVVGLIFLVAIFSFQLNSTEYAVVSTLGQVKDIKEPGLHFRLPFPIQKIYRFDNRQRCFEGNVGKIEETLTADKNNIIVGIFVNYRVSDPVTLFKSERTVEQAENNLNSLMRSSKNEVVGKYNFSDFINTEDKNLLPKIEQDIEDLLAPVALRNYGLEISNVGIKSLGIPEKVTGEVVKRMKSERNAASDAFRQEGKRLAQKIRDEADKEKKETLSLAEAKAKIIRAEGDAQAAAHYAVFMEEPELAVFLKKLDSLKKIMESRTTLVIDTDTAPFDLLRPGSEQINKPQTE